MKHDSRNIFCNSTNDTESACRTPESLLADKHLTREEKDRILHGWEQDQIAMLRAEEENMSRKDGAPSPDDLLARVKNAEKILENCKKKR